jgi:histidinol-phosphate aminotransferase
MRFVSTLKDVPPYEPGARIEDVCARYGLDEVVKLASNEFPLPPFAEVKAVIAAGFDDLNRYPDGHCRELRDALAERYAHDAGGVVVGNGSCELLLLLGEIMLESGDEVVFADPSFLLYRGLCMRRGARPVTVPLRELAHDLEAMLAAIGRRTRMVIVCNPNNPTGTYLPAAHLEAFVEQVPEDVLVVVDEAYNEFVDTDDWQDTLTLPRRHENVILLRTFSKIYGLCGLRVGYGLCSTPVREAVDRVRQPFNVNGPAQRAAREALRHRHKMLTRRRQTAESRRRLQTSLTAIGRPTVPSQANFMLVGSRGLRCAPEQVFETLMSRGVIVRDGAAFGLPGWVRVSVGTQHEIEILIERLSRLVPA